MKDDFYEYLQSLDKKELIDMVYKPKTCEKSFTSVSKRTVALRMSYDGRLYSGIAPQKDKKTIGGYLLNALRMTGLGDNPVYAGRTDAGVSGINMVVSVVAISRIETPNRSYEIREDDYREYRYDLILNNYLPEDVRVTGWAPVPDTFSARFACTQRQYRYYFHKEDLDLGKMNEAASRIKEMTNFYHLSKHSDKNARYERTLDECKIVDDEDMYFLDIKARAFLHNMVRKIVWILLKVGMGGEFSLDRVGIAEPYPLVFTGATYHNKLNFIGGHLSKDVFRKQLREDQTRYKVSKLRLESFDREDYEWKTER